MESWGHISHPFLAQFCRGNNMSETQARVGSQSFPSADQEGGKERPTRMEEHLLALFRMKDSK